MEWFEIFLDERTERGFCSMFWEKADYEKLNNYCRQSSVCFGEKLFAKD